MISSRYLLKLICAVLAVIVSTAYIHIGTGGVFAAEGQDTNAQEAAAAETEIFVVFEEDKSDEKTVDAALDALSEEVDVESAEEVVESVADNGAGMLITVTEGEDRNEAIEALNQTDGVAYAQPNFKYRMMETAGPMSVEVNDAYRNEQYYLNRWDPSFKTSCGAGISDAWELLGGISTGGTGKETVIAVLDSGCQITHHDLAANIDTEHA